MNRTAFLIVTALVELGAAVLLLASPELAWKALVGTDSTDAKALFVARLAGTALLAIAAASWAARREPARGVLAGVLVYDLAAGVLLVYGAAYLGLSGPILWPGAALHAGLTFWGMVCLRSRV